MKRYLLFVSILLFILVCFVFAIPSQISFQGVLKDSSGSPVTGTRTVVFTIYGSPTGADSSWSETQTISVEAGLYNVKLGSVNPLYASSFDGATKYLSLSIGGSELLPRVVMVTVPYAYRAEYADTAGSSGAAQNAVIFAPPTQQTTSTVSAIWIKNTASGTGGTDIRSTISAEASGDYSAAIFGWSTYPSAANNTVGVAGFSSALGANNTGVLGMSRGASGGNGVWGQSEGVNGYGVGGKANQAGGRGVYGTSNSGIGVEGRGATAGGSFEATSGYGVYARGGSGSNAIYGISANTDAIIGETSSATYTGVIGRSTGGGSNSYGVYGETPNGGRAVRGQSSSVAAISGYLTSDNGYAGEFYGGYGIKVPDRASAAAGDPDPGTIFFNTTTHSLEVYDGTNWHALRY